jgi:dipeptidyl-peptidase 4
MKYLQVSFYLSLSFLAFAQKKPIDDKTLLAGKYPENFLQSVPAVNRWIDSQTAEVFIKNEETGKYGNRILDLKTNTLKSLSEAKINPAPSPKNLIIKKGDIYIKQGSSELQLTTDPDALERNPMYSPDSMYVAYTKNNDLYSYNIKLKRETRLTIDGSKTTLNGYATWLYWEEIFGRATAFRAFWWSPDSKKLAFMRFDESKTPMFPIYSSEGTYGYLEETRYPKAGGENPSVKLGFIDPEGEQLKWADFNEKDEQYLGWPEWSLDGSALMVQWINRSNDLLRLYQVSPSSGAKTVIYEETQNQWIAIDEADERLTLLDGNKEMVIISDKTGWKQLYLYTTKGVLKNAITSGNYTVKEVIGIDQKNRVAYLQVRKDNSARYDFYRVGLDGKNLKRLSFGDFNFRKIEPSPDFSYFTLTYSNLNTPASACIIDNTGKVVKELGNAQGSDFNSYLINKPELLRVKSADGLFELPMTIIYPENMEMGKRYPVLVSIYGGPDAGTVYDQWAWSPRTQLLAREGIIQVSLDHRASGHFGKAGVAYMHRNFGKYELEDYGTMVKYLIEKGLADPTKICITGFSYGGFMSCLALTKAADVFTHGMAGGSVTDFGLYDSAYTERFMDTPQENPEGYAACKVMNFVDNYKGKLLIVHGTMDDNVHMQNSIQLIDALQEKKKDFEMMFYPGGRHGWGGAKGQHFDKLKLQFLYKHILEKPMPAFP